MYQKNIEKNHLEIGPGTGYFLKPYNFDNLSLIDVNKDNNKSHFNLKDNCNNINLYQHNIFTKNNKIDNLDINSVGLTYVLHCGQ